MNAMKMNVKINSIYEKEMLVTKGWKPNENLLMHVASFDDFGAHPSAIKENVMDMHDAGEHPVKVKFRLMWYVEEVMDYGQEIL